MDINNESPDVDLSLDTGGDTSNDVKLVSASSYFSGEDEEEKPDNSFADDDSEDDEDGDLDPKDWFFSQADAFGVEIDKESYKDAAFTPEEAKQEVARALAYKHVATQDPLMADLMDKGMTIAEYLKETDSYRNVLAMDDDKVFKGTVWNNVYEEMRKFNQVAVDDKGNLTPESEAAINAKAEKRYGLYDEADRKRIAESTKAQYQKQLETLPHTHTQRMQEMEQKQWESHTNPQIKKIVDVLQSDDVISGINNELGLNIDPKGFADYVKQQLEGEKDASGKLNHKIINRFKTDANFMKIVLATAYAAESGKIQEIKSNISSKALKNMGVSTMPKGKNNSGNDSSSRSSGVKFVPAKDYFKNNR